MKYFDNEKQIHAHFEYAPTKRNEMANTQQQDQTTEAMATVPSATADEEIIAGIPTTELRFGRGKVNSERGQRLLGVVSANGFADNGRSNATVTNNADYDDEKGARKGAASWKRDLSAVVPDGKRVAIAFVENAGKVRFYLYLAKKGAPRGKKAASESK